MLLKRKPAPISEAVIDVDWHPLSYSGFAHTPAVQKEALLKAGKVAHKKTRADLVVDGTLLSLTSYGLNLLVQENGLRIRNDVIHDNKYPAEYREIDPKLEKLDLEQRFKAAVDNGDVRLKAPTLKLILDLFEKQQQLYKMINFSGGEALLTSNLWSLDAPPRELADHVLIGLRVLSSRIYDTSSVFHSDGEPFIRVITSNIPTFVHDHDSLLGDPLQVEDPGSVCHANPNGDTVLFNGSQTQHSEPYQALRERLILDQPRIAVIATYGPSPVIAR